MSTIQETDAQIKIGIDDGKLVGNFMTVVVTDHEAYKKTLTHFLHQMCRFSYQFMHGLIPVEKQFERSSQCVLNFANAQGMCAFIGGKEHWWDRLQPLVSDHSSENRWSEIYDLSVKITEGLGFPLPTSEFLHKP